ncbi:MAG TPA: PP0621 family protein [Ramlibacter sp.]|nr:PP0621 family protein [Ramlibacter sp.]
MKYLVLLGVVLVVWLLWRNSARRAEKSAAPPPAQQNGKPPALPQDMVRCPVCAVHLPKSDALPGPGGQLYCCREHARAGGD